MRILLISPRSVTRGLVSSRFLHAVPLALPTLNALTPEDVEVRIVDEKNEPIPYDESWDLVGITVMAHLSPSAIDIAQRFKKQGIRVAFGGFFPTLLYEDTRDYADTIVAGEAEHIWKDVIRDLHQDQLKPLYKAEQLIDLKDVPFIKKEFFPQNQMYYSIESTRGCPYNCDFCSVTAFYGPTMRHRPIDHVLRQLEELKAKPVFFVDDNVMGNPKYARELFRAMIPLKIEWFGQFSLNRASDRDLMELAAQSGCASLCTGIESLSLDNLQSVNKKWAQPEKFNEWIKTVHDVGMALTGSFMFGFEDDDPDIFKRTLDFCLENQIEVGTFFALTPVKKSPFYERLEAEGRLFETDLGKFDGHHCTFHPKNMTAEQLENGLRWIWENFYSLKSINKRLASMMKRYKGVPRVDENGHLNRAQAALTLNLAYAVSLRSPKKDR